MTTTDWTTPLLAAIDAAAADPGYGHQWFGDIIDELSAKLTAHLAHEEANKLPLIDACLTSASGNTGQRSTVSGTCPTR